MKCLKKIDTAVGTRNYVAVAKGKIENISVEELSKFKEILRRDGNDMKVSPAKEVL